MKWFLCVIIVFIGFCYCADEDTVDIPKETGEGEDGKNYEDKGISRPCPQFNLDCIRYYFAKNGHCSPTYGRVPDPLYISTLVLPLANANITFVLKNAQTKGLNGKVVEFYVNKLTNKVVFAVELRNLTLFSGEVFVRYQRKAKEPIVTTDFAVITFTSITLTAVIPYTNNLQLHKADFNAFIDDVMPSYTIGPNASMSNDPVVQQSFVQLITNTNENVREAFIVLAPIYTTVFIQNRICNFGL